ncbi:MAG: sulfurtransferase complex subunit TusB [Candidatus Magnetobacterium sp. LHC-1]|uniref:Sulfurtransferase complex subunit TusB n=1 Tax=Candidatus Magnetobacterium casense TaxID=1455061 RepID=A0ABS6RUI9_9BACT|nr:sulfurtransferase complex subunit TusB [Candidatus Magnetobacterium casensis]MBF0336832.1 sulfurtransferase complex subunit TusB [Nitrospirota bacterium]MBF0609330.1 sulfurtransferase complex subunit TusB [Nitrospirota bacterium]MBV6340256.1 sulfurtransferase complex subunit TusB [Candidatus Magnetobacterium casensis]
MKLGVFVSQYSKDNDTLSRLKAEKLGVILVQNGVYNAALKEDGKSSPILSKNATIYALSEDLQSRGLSVDSVDSKVKVVDYDGLVDLIFNEYEKIIWL